MNRHHDTELVLTPYELKVIASSPEILAALIKAHEVVLDDSQYVPIRTHHLHRIQDLLPLYEKALTETSSK